jgi:Ni/Co efflux regulator RcnB
MDQTMRAERARRPLQLEAALMKKILSVLVALAFLAGAVPAMAAEPTAEPADAGTTAAPSDDKAAPKTTKKKATKKTTKKTSKDEAPKEQAEPPPAK